MFLLLTEEITANQAYEIRTVFSKASDSWIDEFLEMDGMKQFVSALANVNSVSTSQIEKFKVQFHLLKAIKPLIENKGFPDFITQPELVALIALNLDSEDASICSQVKP